MAGSKLLATVSSSLSSIDRYTILLALAGGAGFIVLYCVYIVIYRLYFHPLRHIPGPKLAAATLLVEFYYNFLKDGSYYLQWGRWHEKYGPVIRITPDEVHVLDPHGYDKIYHNYAGVADDAGAKSSGVFSKHLEFYSSFVGEASAMFFTASNAMHRARRSHINHMFSKKAISEIDWLVFATVDSLVQRMLSTPNQVFNLNFALRAVSLDLTSYYSFGKPIGLMSWPDFGKEFHDMLEEVVRTLWLFRLFPVRVTYAITHMPGLGHPGVLGLLKYLGERIATVKEQAAAKARGEKPEVTHRTIFHELLDSPFHGDKGLFDEGMSTTLASAETVGSAMEMILLGVLSDEQVHRRLKAEIATLPELTQKNLFNLPYLTACIKEGLRMSGAVIGRLPRMCAEDVYFHGYTIPKGCVISQSYYYIHRNPEIFPDPHHYNPERWIEAASAKETGALDINKYLVPFSKGSRHCIGMELAWAEMYATIGTLVRTFPNMCLAENSCMRPEEVKFCDLFSTYKTKDTKPLKIRLNPPN